MRRLGVLVLLFLIALPVFIASYPQLAFSQDAYKKYQLKVLADAKSVEVQIIDQVKGGCWKSPSYSKTLVERQLLSNGVPISDDGDLYVVINGLGFPDHNVSGKRIGCSVYLELYINYFAPVLIPSRTKTVIGEVSVFQTGSLISAGNAVDKRAAELVVQWADEVSVLWLKARQKGVD